MLSYSRSIAAVVLILLGVGCASEPTKKIGTWEGPDAATEYSKAEWKTKDYFGQIITTKHYQIYSTLNDEEQDAQTAELMEGAFLQYQKFAPVPLQSPSPMDCYVFGSRVQWKTYTQTTTGNDAKIYLQINRGGYTVGDKFVIYYLGKYGTSSVAAHEGWHQYVARNFKGKLPPFLEEGLACMFEQVDWESGLPRWNIAVNRARAMALRKACDDKALIPLNVLIITHAGQVVQQSGDRIDAFYAQNWAFAKFMWEAEDGRYRPALQRLLADTANGLVVDANGVHEQPYAGWNPATVQPSLEYYFGMSLVDINAAYQKYLRQIAYEEFNAQWDS